MVTLYPQEDTMSEFHKLLFIVSKSLIRSIKYGETLEMSARAAEFHESNFRKLKWGLQLDCGYSLIPFTQYEVHIMPMYYVSPKYTDVHRFLIAAFKAFRLPQELAIMAVIYMERLVAGGTELRACNWKPILLATLLVASKIWEDASSQNIDFCRANPVYSLMSINRMEHIYADQMNWNLIVSPEEYSEVYYSLKHETHRDLRRQVSIKRFS